MYSYGEEFTYNLGEGSEYFTSLGTIKIKENEYIIAENEYGNKYVFKIDDDEEEVYLMDEDSSELILDAFEREEFDDIDFEAIDDDFAYESKFIEGNDTDEDDEFDTFIDDELVDTDDFDFDIDDEEIDEELDDFLDELFEDEEDKSND